MNYLQSPFMMISLSTMVTSTIMATSSSNWLFIWAAMELNLMSFIPVILSSKSNQEAEGAIKYFLAQALGSALLLSSSFLMWMPESIMYNLSVPFLTISLMLKLGSFPCHFWYPSVMASISWMSCLILSTWQKLAPLCILSFFVLQKTQLILMVAAINSLLGGIIGMNQSQLRSIMAYSSIGHMGWMMSLLAIFKPFMTMMYFTFYCLLIIPMFTIFNKLNMKTVKNISSLSSISPLFQMSMALMFMSLGGLPPLTGFMPKLSVLIMLADKNMVIFILLIMGSLMNLYFYLNIVINTMMMAPKNTKTSNMFYSPNMNSAMMAVALLSLGVMPVIMLMYAMTLLDKS